MGSWASVVLYGFEEGKHKRIIEMAGMPNPIPLYNLAELVSNSKFRKSLIEIANSDLDISFFDSMFDPAFFMKYFTPVEVIRCIKSIERTFKEKEFQFIQPIRFEGMFSNKGVLINAVFVESTVDVPKEKQNPFIGLFKSKSPPKTKLVYSWATIRAYPNKVVLAHWDESLKKYIEKENLLKEAPIIYEVGFNKLNERILGNRILDWQLRKIKYIDEIGPELKSIKESAEFALNNNLKLKIVFE